MGAGEEVTAQGSEPSFSAALSATDPLPLFRSFPTPRPLSTGSPGFFSTSDASSPPQPATGISMAPSQMALPIQSIILIHSGQTNGTSQTKSCPEYLTLQPSAYRKLHLRVPDAPQTHLLPHELGTTPPWQPCSPYISGPESPIPLHPSLPSQNPGSPWIRS